MMGLARRIIVKFCPFGMLPERLSKITIRQELLGRPFCFDFKAAGIDVFQPSGNLAPSRNNENRKSCAAHSGKPKSNYRRKHLRILRASALRRAADLSHFDNGK